MFPEEARAGSQGSQTRKDEKRSDTLAPPTGTSPSPASARDSARGRAAAVMLGQGVARPHAAPPAQPQSPVAEESLPELRRR